MAFLGFTPRLPSFERAKSCSLSSRTRRQFFGLLFFIFLFTAFAPDRAQEQSKEYQLKAAFLYNFAQFVKWPPDSFTNADAPFYIGILGDDPFGSVLEATVQGEAIDHHRLTVVRAQRIEDLKDCQLIFICKSEEGHQSEILSKLGSRPILTVSDVENFAQNGGDIDFYLSGAKVRFEINPQSAKLCGLKISSQLLSLGKIVGRGN